MIGKVVMANYGNTRYWVIQSVVFDCDFSTIMVGENSNTSLLEYYIKNYGLRVSNLKQPLLKAKMNGESKKKMGQQGLLIPEFLLMSGLPGDFDERMRREISQHTINQHQEKLNKIKSLISAFNDQAENFSPKDVEDSLGITISDKV